MVTMLVKNDWYQHKDFEVKILFKIELYWGKGFG